MHPSSELQLLWPVRVHLQSGQSELQPVHVSCNRICPSYNQFISSRNRHRSELQLVLVQLQLGRSELQPARSQLQCVRTQLQLVLTTLQPSCNCNVAMIATHNIVMLQLHTWKKCSSNIVFMDLVLLSTFFQTTWCKRIWNQSYGVKDIVFFRSKSIKDSLHANFLVGGGLSCGWLARPAEGLCICYSKYTLLHFNLVECYSTPRM